MRILLIDIDGVFLDLAMRMKSYGHDVKLFIRKDPRNGWSRTGEGLVDKVRDFRPWMRWADLIVLSGNDYYMHELEPYRQRGFPIFGSNKMGLELEKSREYGQQVLRHAGIDILPYTIFNNYDQAEAFVKKNSSKLFVSKPTADTTADKALSYVPDSPADLVHKLRTWKKQAKLKSPFMLQQHVKGVEMGVSGWHGPNGFLPNKWNENWEHKKLMNDDLGCATGEQGTIMQYCKRSKLATEVLMPLEPYFKSIGYVGDVDVDCIIDEAGKPWPLEFTSRCGWPAFWIQTASHFGDPAIWMKALVKGEDELKVDYRTAIGVVFAQPDYPYGHISNKDNTGMPIYGITDKNIDNLHLCSVMAGVAPAMEGDKIVDKKSYVTTGDYVLCGTALGDTVKECQDKVYSMLDEITLPNNPMYRTDIGDKLKKQLPRLHGMGYATGTKFGD